MPMPYAHLAIAHSCLNYLDVQDRNVFYLGAFMPDIRYFTGKPRGFYHFPASSLDKRIAAMDISYDFVLGYKVHLILDELWGKSELKKNYRRSFPLILRKWLSPKILEVAFEIHCLDQHSISTRLEVYENDLTRSLEITMEDMKRALNVLQQYLDRRSLRSGFEIAQSTGRYSQARLAEMDRISRIIESHHLIHAGVYYFVNRASRDLYNRLVADTAARVGINHYSAEQRS